MLPKVLIGCPTYHSKEYAWKRYVEGIKNLNYSNFDVLIVDNSENNDYFEKIKNDLPCIKDKFLKLPKDRIVHSRNLLRKKVLEEGYDYFLSLEQDVVPNSDDLKKLIDAKKDIVGGVVLHKNSVTATVKGKPVQKKFYVMPMAWRLISETKMKYVMPSEILKNKIMEIDVCSLSCLLIHRKVLEKIEFRYEVGFDDMSFAKDAKKHGFKIFLETSVRPKHFSKIWKTNKETGEVTYH